MVWEARTERADQRAKVLCFMEGNPNADASSDSDSSSNSKMNPPGEMPQGDGNNRSDKSDGPPQQ